MFEPSGRDEGAADRDNTCVDEEGETETFGVLEFIALGEIMAGETCRYDQK